MAKIAAGMAGSVWKVLVKEGDFVNDSDAVIEIE